MDDPLTSPPEESKTDAEVTLDAAVETTAKPIPNPPTLTLEAFKEPHGMMIASRVLDTMPIAVCVFAHDLKYVLANSAYLAIAGSKKPTWQGLTVQEFLPEEVYEHAIPRIRRA